MVPRARGAHLDNVAGEFPETLAQLEKIRAPPDASVLPALQLFPVDIEEHPQPRLLADGAGFAGLFADEPGRSHQLRMGVADVGNRAKAAAKISQQRPPGHPVINGRHGRVIVSSGRKPARMVATRSCVLVEKTSIGLASRKG